MRFTVFEDETADVFLVDEIDVSVLLLASRGTAELCFQMSALDPARHGVWIDPQRLRKTVGGVEAPVGFEPHASQLEVNGRFGTGISVSFQLEANALIAHPRIPGQNRQF